MLRYLTLTGADDSVHPAHLIDLSLKYPFVEWGILLSASQMGNERFPSPNWHSQLLEHLNSRPVPMNISVHLCGRWLRDLLMGDERMFAFDIFKVAQRVQLNFHAEDVKHDAQFFDSIERHPQQEFIFQLDGKHGNALFLSARERGLVNISGLFDTSHGAGVLRDSWPIADYPAMLGYAGGLGPDNIVEQLDKIRAAHNASQARALPFSIDMETKLRTGSCFDLKKCEEVILKVAISDMASTWAEYMRSHHLARP